MLEMSLWEGILQVHEDPAETQGCSKVDGIPGALEQALVGTEVGGDGKDTVAIQHIVRSFDPCMVCTVH